MPGPVDGALQVDGLIRAGLPVANFLIMLGIGMALTVPELAQVARRPKPLLVGLAGHYLLLPLIGFAFAFAFLFRHSYELAVGFVLIAACPSASSSNALTYLARGNLALAVTLTASSTLLTLLTIPLLTGAALQLFAGQSRPIPLPVAQMLGHLVLLVVVPLLAGMAARHLLPRFCRVAESWLNRIGLVLLLGLIAGIVVDQREVVLPWMGKLALATGGMCLAALCAGHLLGRLCGLERRDAVTIGLEVGVQNCLLAFLIAFNVLQSVTLGMPAAIYGVVMYVLAFAFVFASRRSIAARAAAGAEV
ncbi:bile acid:sodium symporter family protein [Pseudoxanthomonas suwonensis]|uniref:bile acid:sodium symporter family protein n=1 Tax=Pseudoxanthomonas suwonensis TaxID=314722 RepID=UPI000698F52E|nr:bile acid:sodium symporter [Pseudoxanthomonas suwonensis]